MLKSFEYRLLGNFYAKLRINIINNRLDHCFEGALSLNKGQPGKLP